MIEGDRTQQWRAWLAYGVSASFYFYEFFARVAPSVMERSIQEDLHASAATTGLALGAYFYIYAIMQLIVGAVFDRVGPKMAMVPAVVAVALGCALEAAAPDVAVLGVARFLQGMGSAFAFVGTLCVASTWFPHHRLAFFSGLTTAVGMTGAIIGNVGIARITAGFGWRSTLAASAVFGFTLATVLWMVLDSRRGAHEKRISQSSATEVSVLQPYRSVLSNPQTWLVGFVAACLYLPLPVLGDLWGNRFVQTQTGADPDVASQVVSMLFVGWLVGSPLAGWASEKLRTRTRILMGSSLFTMLLLALLLVLLPPQAACGMGLLLFFLGIVSSGQVVAFVTAIELNDRTFKGVALSSINMITMMIGGFSQPIVGAILDWLSSSDTASYTSMEFRIALGVMPAVALAGLVASIFIREPEKTWGVGKPAH